MADGIRGQTLTNLKLVRDAGVGLLREQIINTSNIVDLGLVHHSHFRSVLDYMGDILHESGNTRRSFVNWMINHPDLVVAQNPDEVIVANSFSGHAVIADQANRVLDLLSTNLNQLIGVLHNLGDADLEEINQLCADANNTVLDLIDEGRDSFERLLEDPELPASDSTSTSTDSASSSP